MTRLRPFAAPLALLLVTAGFLAASQAYPPDSRAMPDLVGWVMVALLLLDLLSRTPGRAGRAVLRALNPGVSATAPGEGRSLRPVLSIVLFGVALGLLGTAVAVPVYVAAAMRLHGRHTLLASAGAAVATALFVYGLFSVLLRLPLFPGLLFGGDF